MQKKCLCSMAIIAALFIPAALRADDAAKTPAAAAFEKRFLEMMPHHHQGAIEMSETCQTKASHAELKEFCANLISNQRREGELMETWRKSWYQDHGGMSKAEMDQMMAKHKQHMARLSSASGNAYDTMFLQFMTSHHQQAIAEATDCTTRAEHPELKDLCTKMKSDQQKEVATMQGWEKSWSGNAVK